jgi:hypothetical protein
MEKPVHHFVEHFFQVINFLNGILIILKQMMKILNISFQI